VAFSDILGALGNALLLQYACHGSRRQYYAIQSKPAPLSLQLPWVELITASGAFVHSRNVLHGDISCNNVLLDGGCNTKLCDFAGSSIDGLKNVVPAWILNPDLK